MQAPRGTRDFGPDEMARRRALEARMRSVLRTYNYREVQTPTFEDLELFLAKSGPAIRDEIYAFRDKSDRDLALRPELTAPVMRFYFRDLKMAPKPLRLFYHGPCYRYDRPQAGRYREFWQMGCELVGDDRPEAHAELLRLALELFEASGLRRYELRVGHLEILRSLLESVGVPRAEQSPLMRLIDKKELGPLEVELGKRLPREKTDRVLRFFEASNVQDARAFASGKRAADAAAHLDRVLSALATLGGDSSKVRVDPTIARGLEYYTGLVFELDAPDLGAEKQLLGGGEYDLSSVFGQPPVAAAGFALGFDRTLVALERAGHAPQSDDRVDAYVAALEAAALGPVQRAATQLRDRGLRVELESRPLPLKRFLSRASQIRARSAVFVGAKEVQRGVASIKLLETGVQHDAPMDAVGDRVASLLQAK